MDRIKEDYNLLQEMGYEVLGVFLQGSQNYQLDYEDSDIDTKAIIIPTFDDFVLKSKAVSYTKVLDTQEHIDIKDIRLMFDCFSKQNINFLEILFTKHFYINPKYQKAWTKIIINKEKIARLNNYAGVNCIAGMVFEKYKALEHPYPSIEDKITKYGYDPKQLHHILRCQEFLRRYINGVKYEDCLISNHPKYFIEVKKGIHTLEKAREIANRIKEDVVRIKNLYMNENPVKIDFEARNTLNEVLIEVLKTKFKEDIGD
jgi:predicted nucleotidyltransferase